MTGQNHFHRKRSQCCGKSQKVSQLLVFGSCVPSFNKFCMEVFQIEFLLPYGNHREIHTFYKKVNHASSIRLS